MAGEKLMRRSRTGLCRKRRGLALGMVLVTLLVGGAFVAVAFLVVNNLFFSSQSIIDRFSLYNEAQDGLEIGKSWLRNAILADDRIPRWEAPNASNILNPADVSTNYEILIVKTLSGDAGEFTYKKGETKITVRIYDTNYTPGAGLVNSYRQGFPPQGYPFPAEGEESLHQSSSYASSNRGEGFSGSGSEGAGDRNTVLIRSTATDGRNRHSRTVESFLIVRK